MACSRTSRWSSPSELSPIVDQDGSPLPTAIWAHMTPEQLETYVLHLRTLEITRALQIPDSLLAEKGEARRCRRSRTASPDPEYDAAGRRTNTRLQRRRQAPESERHDCVEGIVARLPAYRVPSDYRRPKRFSDRLTIPATEFPSVNSIGQILGPRGRSLKDLQERCRATIMLRGRGSTKQGKASVIRREGEDNSDSQPLHAVICADSKQKVAEAKRLLQDVVDNAISSPEEQNDRKRQQLRDLAVINGTFRDDEARLRVDVPMSTGTVACTRIGQLMDSTNDRWEEEYEMLMKDIRGG